MAARLSVLPAGRTLPPGLFIFKDYCVHMLDILYRRIFIAKKKNPDDFLFLPVRGWKYPIYTLPSTVHAISSRSLKQPFQIEYQFRSYIKPV
jgi:hypothetical protein